MKNFNEFKQNKNRGIAVKGIAEELVKRADEYESVLVIAIKYDKGIDTAYSTDNDGELVGALELSKSILIDGIRERESFE